MGSDLAGNQTQQSDLDVRKPNRCSARGVGTALEQIKWTIYINLTFHSICVWDSPVFPCAQYSDWNRNSGKHQAEALYRFVSFPPQPNLRPREEHGSFVAHTDLLV
ncbi:hypothetical protein RRG08_017734 [Elysia crispata]|uniref:Uncharacterized protein n=1 Tax=Elysia crispata TaxID=231223 RepID=A0AAE0XSB4_9GAST|nr:hypothetical protein RRG08_017734 [Elysia crispata]